MQLLWEQSLKPGFQHFKIYFTFHFITFHGVHKSQGQIEGIKEDVYFKLLKTETSVWKFFTAYMFAIAFY